MKKATWKKYYTLTKPGVLYANALTGVAGFLLAAGTKHHFEAGLFLATIGGMTLIIASACVLNNYLDRDIDRIMERTKTRPTANGSIRGRQAVPFSIILGTLGIAILCAWTNLLVVGIGVAGFVDYVVLYGMLSKRLSIHGTLVGSISGAAPILAGYCAVTNHIDAGAVLVFLILFLWQMPEFYSISIYRHDEYKAAGVPVMSVVKGKQNTRTQIFIYTLAFTLSTLLLTPFGYTGWIYFIVMGLLGAYWLWLGMQGFKATNLDAWSRKMFRFSLIVILALCVMLPLGPLLP
jgi:protoheme IX farnesyltransferase